MEVKTYSSVFSPDLEISDAFAAAWNDIDEARVLGQSPLSTQKCVVRPNLSHSDHHQCSQQHTLRHHKASPSATPCENANAHDNTTVQGHIHIEERKQSDGTALLIIDIDEG